jgi:hypothetical protein
MTDEVDRADAEIERSLAEAIRLSRRAELPPGEPGDCDTCGEWSGRLVEGMCAPCRDRYAKLEILNGRPH